MSEKKYQPLPQTPSTLQWQQPVGMVYVQTPQVIQPVQVVPQLPVYPNSHLVLTAVLLVILTLLAPETLLIMVPAFILATMSHNAIAKGDYLTAKHLGMAALALNFIAVIVGSIVAIVAIGLSLGLHHHHPYRYYDYVFNYGGCFYDYDYEGSGAPPEICY